MDPLAILARQDLMFVCLFVCLFDCLFMQAVLNQMYYYEMYNVGIN
jgi:hypothetical protein